MTPCHDVEQIFMDVCQMLKTCFEAGLILNSDKFQCRSIGVWRPGRTFPQPLGNNLGYVVSLHKLTCFEPLDFDLWLAVLVLFLKLFPLLKHLLCEVGLEHAVTQGHQGLAVEVSCHLEYSVTVSLVHVIKTVHGLLDRFLVLKLKVSLCPISSPWSLGFLTNFILVHLDLLSMISSGFRCFLLSTRKFVALLQLVTHSLILLQPRYKLTTQYSWSRSGSILFFWFSLMRNECPPDLSWSTCFMETPSRTQRSYSMTPPS